jgi:YD repeat-containing protein
LPHGKFVKVIYQGVHVLLIHYQKRLRFIALVGMIGLFSSFNVYADSSDDRCTPLYQATGAVPGNDDCSIRAATADVGLATRYCTSDPTRIQHYCSPPVKSGDPSCKAEASNPNSCIYDPSTAGAEKNAGDPGCKQNRQSGNPIDHGTGNKRQLELDYLGSGGVALALQRTYNALSIRNGRYGARWSSNYDRMVMLNAAYPNNASVTRGDGKAIGFVLTNGIYQPDGDITDSLTRLLSGSGNPGGWQYKVDADQSVESYDASGRLISITSRTGVVQTLSYSDATTPAAIAPQAGLLLRVTDSFGHQLNFVYDSSSRIVQMKDPAGGTVGYTYDSNNNLASVTHQDGKTRTYVYNEATYTGGANLPTALTGIVDENSGRFAIFKYDSTGKAISTEHAGGVEKYSVAYPQLGIQSIVTDPLNAARTYLYQTILNTIRNTSVSQPGGAGCGAASNGMSYDTKGNVATRTNFNGIVTTYSYDLTRNMETSRVEGAGTAQARTITTSWHATYSLPLKIAEPKLLATYTYDASGNLLSRTVQATSDNAGAQGLSPTLIGTARTWSYTYNAFGQILTATGPRTDVTDKTTYVYDSSGNLSTITNAIGQVTTLSNYDANGRVGLITDANGTATALTYSPRGWLTGQTITGGGMTEASSYSYDNVGQLTLVTLPNASTVSYTYDPAHRLTNIADSLGNSIVYTLDNMSNRIGEQVKDPNGALTRQASGVVDALNRLQQVTGAVQ